MIRAKYAILEGVEQLIITLRNGACWLCRWTWTRRVASPLYVALDALADWYWEKVL